MIICGRKGFEMEKYGELGKFTTLKRIAVGNAALFRLRTVSERVMQGIFYLTILKVSENYSIVFLNL